MSCGARTFLSPIRMRGRYGGPCGPASGHPVHSKPTCYDTLPNLPREVPITTRQPIVPISFPRPIHALTCVPTLFSRRAHAVLEPQPIPSV